MRELIAIEARRYSSRRITRVFAALVVLGFLAAVPIVFAKSNRDIETATAKARADAIAGYQECVAVSGEKGGEPCEVPSPSQIYADPRFHLTDLISVSEGLSGLLILLGLVGGATFVGADWHHRVITTQLTWEARRTRVVLAKAAAAALVTFGAAIVLVALFGLSLVPAAVFRGTTDGATAAWFGDLAGAILRGAAAAGAAAAIGSAIAMIGRATAAAVGVLFAWIVIGENAIRAGIPGWERWLVTNTIGAFVSDGGPEFVRGAATAGLILACYTALTLAVATRVFERRDIA